MLGFAAVVAQFFSQLDDYLVERAGRAVVVLAPDFVEKTVAREDFTRMGIKDLQQLQFASGEFLDGFLSFELECFWIDDGVPDLEGCVAMAIFRFGIGPATKQCMDASEEFADAKRL